MNDYILEVKDLHTSFRSKTDGSITNVLNGVSFGVKKGEILGVVGESGSGKSVTMLSVMRLLGKDADIRGEVLLNGENLLDYDERQMRSIRGSRISMIFQDPMTSLNPVYTIGNQMREIIRLHRRDIEDVNAYAAELLETVGISDGLRHLKQYPHELSGGMRQRVSIAMALSSNPDILIADEPTTALDVTVQAQIIDLIRDLTKKRNMTTVIITHDLGIIAGLCDSVVVLYAGRLCEKGSVYDIFRSARHEYTKGLIAAVPNRDATRRLIPIEGTPVNLQAVPDGCAFCARCKNAMAVCMKELPTERQFSPTHTAWCWMNEREEAQDD